MTFDELLVGCIAMLGVPGGMRARESLRRVLKAWSEDGDRHDCDSDSVGVAGSSSEKPEPFVLVLGCFVYHDHAKRVNMCMSECVCLQKVSSGVFASGENAYSSSDRSRCSTVVDRYQIL